MKNQFFFAMVPVMALLAGCPTGPGDDAGEGEGEGEVGEGEGEGEPFTATLDMTLPNPISEVVVNGEPDTCEDLMAHTYQVDQPGSYEAKPTPTDTNRRCVAQGVEVEEPGSYPMDWAGKCGPFPNGSYDEPNEGIIVNVTTTDTGQALLISDDALLPPFDLVVSDDGTFYGEGDDFISSGTISDDLCTITIHQEGSGGAAGDFLLLSRSDSCAG